MLALNRSLLFTDSEFFFACLNIEVFCYKNRMFFFLENRSWSLSTIGVFSDFLQPGLCAFQMCKARLIKNIRPYFIASVPSTFSDLSAPVVLW